MAITSSVCADRFDFGQIALGAKDNPIVTSCDIILPDGTVGKIELSFSNTARQ